MLRIGNKKIWSISYADDICLIASGKDALKEMLKKMGSYLEKKKLGLNEDKTKIMIFGETRGRKAQKNKDERWQWKGKNLEVVKEINYLGYCLSDDNKDTKHISKQTAKARSIVGKIWSIGESFYKNEWKERKILFEALMKSVMFYGIEIWGYERKEEMERLKRKYIKWVLKLDKNTPDYGLRRELKESSLWLEGIERIKKYESKLEELKDMDIRKEIWRRKCKNIGIKN